MRKRFIQKAVAYVVCLSFLFLMSGIPELAAESKGLPIGEMVAKGEVKLGANTLQGKGISSSFPIFSGSTITTEKGLATIRLSNNSLVGVYADSSFSLDQMDRLTLSKGTVEFYLPPSSEARIQAGNVSIVKSPVQQAGNNSATSSPKDEWAFGSISIQPNGSVTVKNVQGRLSILNPNNTVLAALAPKESMTISITSEGKLQVAQATADKTATTGSKEFLGLSTWEWVGAGAMAVGIGAGIGFAAGGSGGSGGAVCP